MAAENARRAQLLSMGDRLRDHALASTPDNNAAYMLVHRVLAAAFRDGRAGSGDERLADLRLGIDRLAGQSGVVGARHVAT